MSAIDPPQLKTALPTGDFHVPTGPENYGSGLRTVGLIEKGQVVCIMLGKTISIPGTAAR